MPGFSIADFSLSPDGRQIAFSALGDVSGVDNDRKFSLWVAPADHSAPARMLQTSANRSHFASGFIYYVKRTPDGGYVHRVRPDGTDDQQIWDGKVLALATSPDGRYLAVAEPVKEDGEWRLEIVDWAQKRVQPVCNDALAYWSDDGGSLILFTGIGKMRKNTSTYLVALPPGKYLPELPPDGFSEFSQIAKVKNARMIPERVIALGRNPDTYAYVRASVQRNLYSIPLP
jgi:Tol biopolymer transport system component